MPKQIRDHVTATNGRRKSTRSLTSMKKIGDYEELKDADEVRMPAGYNPSDDSEDEYVPPVKNKKIDFSRTRTNKRSRNKSDDDDDDDDDDESEHDFAPTKKRLSSKMKSVKDTIIQVLSTKQPEDVIVKKPKDDLKVLDENTFLCPKCPSSKQEKMKIDGNARFHLSLHYYDEGAYSHLGLLVPTDVDKNGRPKDEKGISIKYCCQYEGCTKRKMGYKEMCVHLSIQHMELIKLIHNDTNLPQASQLLKILYPQESGKQASEGLSIKMNATENDPEPLHKLVRSSSAASAVSVPEMSQTPLRPRVDRVVSCILCTDKSGKNLDAGKSELKYHMAVCVYKSGGFLKYLDPHQDVANFGKGQELFEEFGARYKYKCEFEGCDKANAKSKPVGYKEFAIHAGR